MFDLSRTAHFAGGPKLGRDSRIDLLRGFALLTIFIDHVSENPLSAFTLRNFGFSDAAEMFVILAGVSAMIAYGRIFERDGARSGLRKVLLRCLKLYVFQIGMLLMTLALVHEWREGFGLEPELMAPFYEQPLTTLAHMLTLHALPASLNILPLYIVVLGAFPLLYAGMRAAPLPTLAVSGGLWLIANLDHGFNITNWLDGKGWYFNPFAWQFLFALGMLGAAMLRANGGELPRFRLLRGAAWAYLAAALLLAAPWRAWGLSDVTLFDFAPPDKTALSPLRLLDILALMYLALSSPVLRRLAEHRWVRPVVACGRHSLEVFSFATLAALLFRLMFYSYGQIWTLEVAVNVVGIGAMLALGVWLDEARAAGSAGRAVPVGAAQ